MIPALKKAFVPPTTDQQLLSTIEDSTAHTKDGRANRFPQIHAAIARFVSLVLSDLAYSMAFEMPSS